MFSRSALFTLAVGALSHDALALSASPLRGEVGQVDDPVASDETLVYGPFEAGFSSQLIQDLFDCSTDGSVAAGMDTALAELIVEDLCGMEVSVLDSCGGHALPYHYHESMSCLYSESENGHSSRIATMTDGHGLYGQYINGTTLPTDLDACGGRYGVTPDSTTGDEEYYYMVRDEAPFTVGCFGPNTDGSIVSVDQCRDLYDTCGDGDAVQFYVGTELVTYDPDCPCFDDSGSNVGADDTSWETNSASTSTSGAHSLTSASVATAAASVALAALSMLLL